MSSQSGQQRRHPMAKTTVKAAATPAPAEVAEPATNKSIINSKYRDRYKTQDWLGEQIAANCSASHDVEVIEKGADGKPTGKKTTKTVADGIDVDKLNALA